MANGNGNNGWGDAARYLGVILAAIALLGAISGSVWAWANVNYQVDDVCKRTDRLEARQEQAETDMRRLERKIDRLLIEQGLNPDDIR